jgi:aminopeptidase N
LRDKDDSTPYRFSMKWEWSMFNLKVLVSSLIVATMFTACSGKSDAPVAPSGADTVQSNPDTVPQAQLGDNVTPTNYAIDLTIDPRNDSFSGVVTIDVDVKRATSKIWLHGQTITANGALARLADGSEIAAQYTEVDLAVAPSGVASLTFAEPVGPGAVVLVIPYTTPYNTKLNSAYKAEREGDSYIVTQFEAIGARQAFPGFDEPRFKVPFALSITAPTEDVVYANTPEIKTEASGGMTRHTFATTRPLPTYLLAFGVGPWDVVDYEALPPTDIRKNSIPLRGIATRGEGKNMQYALKNTAGILETLEAYFGIPYPYEKLDLIAAPEYAFGAMENPGAIVFTEFLLMMDEKSSLGQRRAYASVNAHELAHQWFGDLVTPVWWEDIWLNEAFATWMGNKTVTTWAPDYKFGAQTLKGALGVMGTDSLATTRKVREPLLQTENVMDQFDGITYRKGGGVLSMFESYLGEDNFQKGVRLHMERFEDGVASADDFFQSLADGSGNAKVVPALKSFVDQPGLPMVSGALNCESNELELSQSRYAPHGSRIEQGQTWKIPVCLAYGAGGERTKTCTMLESSQTSIALESETCPSWITLNADGAGYYRFSLDSKGWDGLLGNLDALNKSELLSVLDSFEAAFRANKMDAATYLNGLASFSGSGEYDVALKAGGALAGMKNNFVDKSAHEALAKFTRELYADRYAAIKDADTMEANLMVPTLANRLVSIGNDTDMASGFAAAGSRYLGLDGDADKSALSPKMRGLGLAEAFKARGAEAMPALMALAKSGSPAEKGSAVGALASTEEPELVAQLLSDALSGKDVFTNRQAGGLVAGFMGNPETRPDTWIWFKENFDTFVKNRVADVRRGSMPRYGGGFCGRQKMAEVEAFFESKADIIAGYERSLAQTLERIQLCTALRGAQNKNLTEALNQRYAD